MKISTAGYTLIELLVSITIFIAISTFSISYYSDFSKRKKLEKAGNTLRQSIRIAANKAINNEKNCDSSSPNSCTGPDEQCATNDDLILQGWFIDFSTSPPQIYGKCGQGAEETTFGSKTINNLQDFNIDYNQTIQFMPLTRTTNLQNSVTINVTSNGDTYTLSIDRSGDVSVL